MPGLASAPVAMPAQPVPVAERRVCSVLFADLVGFTPLSESRDAEAVRELLSGYFEVARTVISRYGGTVEKFIGDAVMAVWGAPTTHEDDAERCVRAAIELVDAVSEYGRSHGAAGLTARAGVVTGEVAVTLGAASEGLVAGDAVNTAARVQAESEPGGVLVDDTTRQVTGAAIAYVDTGPHMLKGKADAVRLWRATRVLTAIGGSERVDGLEASFLGRDRELRQVKDSFHESVDQQKARLVSVLGAAGVGKSRLRWEFFKYADGLAVDFLYHAGRCLPYGDGVAYWALAEMVRARLDITEEEGTDGIARKLDDGLNRWVSEAGDREFLRPRLGALLGVADPGLGQEELFAGWRLWFERLTDDAPVVMVIEDLQWADTGLLDFVEQLLDWSADQPIFVLTLSRPELLDRRGNWGSGRRNAVTVSLDRLTDPVMTELLEELVPGIPAQVAGQIVERADGIPLYAVELVRSLIDRDLVRPIDGVYRLVGTVEALDVPASLTSLVAARIDALPAEERALVQGLAVLGGTFPRAAAAAVTDLPAEMVDQLLADLVRREILRVRSDRLSPERGQYAFTQSLLRQVAYDTLARRDRKARHLAVAAHLRATFADDGAEVAEVIAQHYMDAYQAAPDDPDSDHIRAEAARAFTRSGDRATAIGAPSTAEAAYSRAADLLSDAAERTALLEQAGRAAAQANRPEMALARFNEAAAAYTAAGDRLGAARMDSEAGNPLFSMGRIDEAITRQRHAAEVLAEAGPSAALAHALTNLAGSLAFSEQAADAGAQVDASMRLAEALELPDVLAEAAQTRAVLLGWENRPQEALATYRWAIELAEQHGLGRQARLAHGNAGDLCINGDLPGGAEHSRAALEIARRRGERHPEVIGVANLASLYLLTGQWDEAEQLCRGMLEESTHLGDEILHMRLAALHALRGQLDLARQQLGELGDWAATEDVQWRNSYTATAVTVAVAAGEADRALDLGGPAVSEVAQSFGLRNDMFRELWPDVMDATLTLARHDQADELLTLLANRPLGHVPPYLRAQLARYRARLAAARGQHQQVDADFTAAERILGELEYPYWLALAQLDHAAWLIDQQRPEIARPRIVEAIATLDRLHAQPALSRARDLLSNVPAPPEISVPEQQPSSAPVSGA